MPTRPTPITVRQLNAEKRRLIVAIRELVSPHTWASGFGGGTLVWAPKDKTGEIASGFMIPGFRLVDAVTETGVADIAGGGMSIDAYEDLPLEDLILIERWARKTFGSKAR